jgi:hypothetical protein
VGTPYAIPSSRRGCSSTFCRLHLAVSMPGVDYRHGIDRSSQVRVRLRLHVKTILGNQMLTTSASIAIWNKNKVVVAITIIVWMTSIGFHIRSKFLPLTPVKDLESCIYVIGDSYRAGEWPNSNNFRPIWLISSVGQLYMVPYAIHLWAWQERFQRGWRHRYNDC